MALLTPMTLTEAQALGAQFGLEVAALHPIEHGSVNSNFRVDLVGGGRSFLRVCEESDRDAVERQNALLAHLVAHGVKTPAPFDGIAEHCGKPVAAFPFCVGEWICQQRVTAEKVQHVGAALAAIHRAGEGYDGAPIDRFGAAHLRQRIDDLRGSQLNGELAAEVDLLAARLDELGALSYPATTVIHGDVFRDNVLWDGDRLSAVLDFESASMGHPAFDLMVTLLAWCFGDDLEQPLAQALLAAYQAVRPLPDQEITACYDQARAAAVRFAVTRITDYELRPRGVVVYKDYRRFMGRLAAIEAIGRDAFVRWLGCA